MDLCSGPLSGSLLGAELLADGGGDLFQLAAAQVSQLLDGVPNRTGSRRRRSCGRWWGSGAGWSGGSSCRSWRGRGLRSRSRRRRRGRGGSRGVPGRRGGRTAVPARRPGPGVRVASAAGAGGVVRRRRATVSGTVVPVAVAAVPVWSPMATGAGGSRDVPRNSGPRGCGRSAGQWALVGHGVKSGGNDDVDSGGIEGAEVERRRGGGVGNPHSLLYHYVQRPRDWLPKYIGLTLGLEAVESQ